MKGHHSPQRRVGRGGRRGKGAYPEGGAVALFSAVAVFALLVSIGLVVDGGSKIRGLQRADELAAEAARTGAQAVNFDGGTDPTIDMAQACAAVSAYVAQTDGHLSDCGPVNSTTLQVEVVVSSSTIFLSLVGQPTWEATGSAQARLARGIGGEF